VIPLHGHRGTRGERRYSSYSFLTSTLDAGEWSASRSGRALPPGTHLSGGRVGPRAGLDAEARGKILCLCRESNPGRPVRSQTLYWLSYRGSLCEEWVVIFSVRSGTVQMCGPHPHLLRWQEWFFSACRIKLNCLELNITYLLYKFFFTGRNRLKRKKRNLSPFVKILTRNIHVLWMAYVCLRTPYLITHEDGSILISC
jgi:hypothetical protein